MDLSVAKGRLAAVVKPDSITTSKGDFLATHVEIKKLVLLNKFEFVPMTKDYITEDQFYNKFILNPLNKHQFIVVYGQSGTGKSHLIRWFDARFESERPDDEVVLFVRRSDNTLKGTIRQLLEKPEVQDISNKEIIKRLANASVAVSEDKLKDMIFHNFIIELNNDDGEQEIQLNNIKRKRLVAFLLNDTIHKHLLEIDGPIERIYSKVAENTMVDRDTIAQFKAEDFLVSVDLYDDMQQAGADPKALKMALTLMSNEAIDDAKLFANYLNQFVGTVIQRCAGIEPGDFEQVFMDIRKELFRLGKNLTLFIEDITSFTGVDNALLNALMEEHNDRDICRLSSIIGGTNAYINDCFRQNHRDRVTQFLYIPDDVFDEKGVLEFVGRYINTMSLSESTIMHWIQSGASADEYPIHEIKEGGDWEYIDIAHDKKLPLFPFSKNSIRYLYKNELTKGHQTPRYIIRDMIEPVVNDYMSNKSKFPSINYNLVNINVDLNFMVHNQIKDQELADRLFRFMSIWGNNTANQFTANGLTYISGLPVYVYEYLDLPVVSLQSSSAPIIQDKVTSEDTPHEEIENIKDVRIPTEKQRKLDDVTALLTQWVNGAPINLGTTGGTEGIVRTAREDMGDFLLSAIDWQIEGVSLDNVSKVKAAISGKNSRYKLVALENQTKGEGYYILPANWDSLRIINAFIRFREIGKQSWDYPGSDLDCYIITSWISQIKNEIVKAVKQYDENHETKYIEAAIAAEMYRLILNGEYREKTLNGLSSEYLLTDHKPKDTNTCHSVAWKSLLAMMRQKNADMDNRETVRQYFRLVQGNTKSSFIVLDPIGLAKTIRRVKSNHLLIPGEEFQKEDKVKLRKDVYSFLGDITSRIDSVAKAEVKMAEVVIQPIYECFDDDEIDEDDISDFLATVKRFYDEINSTQINIKNVPTDTIKKGTKQIAKAIGDIGKALNEKDPLAILMAFSGDPVGTIQPFVKLLEQITKDINDVDKEIASRIIKLGPTESEEVMAERYSLENQKIDADMLLIEELR